MAKKIGRLVVLFVFAPAFLSAVDPFGQILASRDDKGTCIHRGKKATCAPKMGILPDHRIETKSKGFVLLTLNKLQTKIGLGEKTNLQIYKKKSPTRLNKGVIWVHKSGGSRLFELKGEGFECHLQQGQIYIDHKPQKETRVAVQEGELSLKTASGWLRVGRLGQVTLKNGVPPIIIGITEGQLLNWKEPFEQY